MGLAEHIFAIQGALQSSVTLPKVLPFAEWLPDRAALGLQAAVTALNVRPSEDGFRPVPGLSTQSDALTARAQGASAVRNTAGAVSYYAGDETKLYRLAGSTFSDVSGATYTTAEDANWEFAKFGNTILATNYADAVQGATIGSGNFSDQFTSTDKPKAYHVDIVRDFVVLGNTNDTTDGVKPSRVWWGGINSSVDMTPSATTQSDFQDMPDGGWVQRVVGGIEYGLVFQEEMIRRMTYVGTPLIFSIDSIDRARGTPIPQSVITYGRFVFFIASDGFFMTDGVQTQPIGNGKVDRTFWDQFDIAYASRVSAAIDPVSKVVMWAFPGTGSSSGNPNKIYFYHWPTGKWSEAEVDTEVIFRALAKGYTLDGLDAVSTNLDTLAFSLDSRAWTGQQIKLAIFNQSHILTFMDGSNLAATIDTGDVQLNPAGLATVNNVSPLVDGGTAITVALDERARIQDSVSFGTASTIDSNGRCNLLSTARFHRFRTTIPAATSWNHAQGVRVDYINAGTD